MSISFPRSPFLSQLFPNIDIENDQQLENELINFYSFDGQNPILNVSDEKIEIELPAEINQMDVKAFGKATIYFEMGKSEEARPILEQLIDEEPRVSEYHRWLAQICEEAGQYDKAIIILRDALRWNPENIQALILMGNIYAKFYNDIQTAVVFYDQVMDTSPENYIALNSIGETFLQSGKLNLAERFLVKAHQVNPSYPNNLLALGLLKLQKMELFQAFRYASEALKYEELTEGQVYKTALKLALDSARLLVKQHEIGEETMHDFIQEIETLTGKQIRV